MSACLRKLPIRTAYNLSVVTPRRLNCVHTIRTPSCQGAAHRRCRRLLLNARVCVSTSLRVPVRWKSSSDDKDISSIIQPIPVKPCADPDGINVGEELTGTLKKGVFGVFMFELANRRAAPRIRSHLPLFAEQWLHCPVN